MNILTATMPIWIGVLIVVPFVLLAIIGLVAALQFARRYNWQIDATTEALKLERENAHLQDALEKSRAQFDVTAQAFTELDSLHQKVVAERQQLYAENADLREALQEAQAEIKALQMNTIEVPEVAPERKPIRRNMSKKAETKQ